MSVNDRDVNLLSNASLCCYRLGRFTESMRLASQGLAVDPSHQKCMFRYVCAGAKIGTFPDAAILRRLSPACAAAVPELVNYGVEYRSGTAVAARKCESGEIIQRFVVFPSPTTNQVVDVCRSFNANTILLQELSNYVTRRGLPSTFISARNAVVAGVVAAAVADEADPDARFCQLMALLAVTSFLDVSQEWIEPFIRGHFAFGVRALINGGVANCELVVSEDDVWCLVTLADVECGTRLSAQITSH
jgi:hypothetical protein